VDISKSYLREILTKVCKRARAPARTVDGDWLAARTGLLLKQSVETTWWRRAATWTVGGDDLLVGGEFVAATLGQLMAAGWQRQGCYLDSW
jgi:hypothetical protein